MTPILVVSFSVVLLVIASLDRPANSFITVSQQPLLDWSSQTVQSLARYLAARLRYPGILSSPYGGI